MDNFINLAKQGYQAYETSQNQNQNQSQQQQSTPAPQQYKETHGDLPVDHNQAAQIANSHSGDSGNSDLFTQALSFLGGGKHSEPVNEEHVTKAHDQVYSGGDTSNLSANSIGSAAALKVLKDYMTGGQAQSTTTTTTATTTDTAATTTNSGGGDFQTKMIGMAMSEAAKIFDKTGGKTEDKQEAVNGAATTMFKLMVQSKLSGGGQGGSGGGVASLLGGGNSGGLGSLLDMASQYTKTK